MAFIRGRGSRTHCARDRDEGGRHPGNLGISCPEGNAISRILQWDDAEPGLDLVHLSPSISC